MSAEIQKTYSPKETEEKIYAMWLANDCFRAHIDKRKKPFTMVMPPPNITGKLHLGHAQDNTLQDCIARYKRMKGFSTLWLPGTDHAAIATELKIVEMLEKNGESKEQLGREEFLRRAWSWKEEYGSAIVSQIRRLGSSCDWSRERFTLDEGCSQAVNEVFVRLYSKGLIYRGERMINWCPSCHTSLSDAEVEHEEQNGKLWHIKYMLEDGTGHIVVATTRPETMLGDTAVAVNPMDSRYSAMIGKMLVLPIVNRVIPVIADDYVDMSFGTGCVKITPAHDPNDFEMGLRHNLPSIQVIDDNGCITSEGARFAGQDRYQARKNIVSELEDLGALVKIDEHNHNVGTCYRCSTTVEPLVSKQWFVRMSELAKPAISAVKAGKTRFIPERFDKIYYHWMENIKDWCISRQLWWGHRIPAYYCDSCGEVTISKAAPEKCSHCGCTTLHQDEDTLDTWFSSALWPFSTLGWPEKTDDFNYFYPTNTLVTGYDIIFFWVARMIFSGIEQTGQTPFDTVLIHGLVRDAQGRKMSKSLGNGVDPIEIIDTYGADTLRLTLLMGTALDGDMRFSDDKVLTSRNFTNKLWNAFRFILMNVDVSTYSTQLPNELAQEDRWVLSVYNRLVAEVTENMEKYELGIAVQKLYDFVWDIYCDWYIELAKSRLTGSPSEKQGVQSVLLYIMNGILRLLHPFIPFITEELWQSLIKSDEHSKILMLESYPAYTSELEFEEDEKRFTMIIDLIKSIRALRAEMKIPPSKKAPLYIATEHIDTFKAGAPFLERLGYASTVTVDKNIDVKKALRAVTTNAVALIPMLELIDRDEELARLQKQKQTCEADIVFIKKKLDNKGFMANASKEVVEETQQKLEDALARLQKLEDSIRELL